MASERPWTAGKPAAKSTANANKPSVNRRNPAKSSAKGAKPGKPVPEALATVSVDGPERIQKLLARAGVGSRREIEGWMDAGRLLVNGQPVTPGQKATVRDVFELDGKRLEVAAAAEILRRVLIYNKPEGEVTTRKDPEGRPTVFDRLPRLSEHRWISIGRLDLNTTGLVMFTTDGELANRLMHPSSQIDREYAVRIFGEVDDAMIERLRTGVTLEDGEAKFTDISAAGGTGMNRWFHVTLLEGRNREVRRLWESQGVRVSRLKRVRYGSIFLPSRLTVGKWEELDQKAVDLLSRTVGLAKMEVPQQTPDEVKAQARQQRKAAPVTNRSNRAAGSPGSKAGQGARKWAVADSKPQRSGGKSRSDKPRG